MLSDSRLAHQEAEHVASIALCLHEKEGPGPGKHLTTLLTFTRV